MITVLIPTTDRPAMLRQALVSVRRQTARDRIAAVIVSENGGGHASASVCAEFADLPVRHVRRDPPTSSFAHFAMLLSELPGQPYTAILHDDDWWDPQHLSAALEALADGRCAAHFANHFTVAGERSPLGINPYSACWYASGFGRVDERWLLDPLAVALACLPVTPCHCSALLCRTADLAACRWIYDIGNPFDSDRLLALALSRRGPLSYDCMPRAFVRMHPAQDGRAFDWDAQVRWMSDTTRRVVAQCDELALDLRGALASVEARCPAEFRPTLEAYFALPWCGPVLASLGLPRLDTPAPRSWKDATRRWLPPALLDAWRGLRRRAAAR